MPNTRTYTRTFSGGEISPEMFGRIDDAKFQTGAALLRNFIATPQGPAENRPGFAFVCGTKGNGAVRLIPFTYSADQTMVIEMGAGYFRFHTQGQTLELPTGIPAYIPGNSVTFTPGTPGTVNWTAHGLSNGMPVQFLSTRPVTGRVPTGLVALTTYYVVSATTNTFQIAATVGGPALAIGDVGVGPQNGFYAYKPGDLVTYGGSTYYCVQFPIMVAPGVPSVWYPIPTGAYEIPNSYAAADLMNIHFVQSEDVLTLVHPSYPPAELERLGASTWTFTGINFGAALPAPQNVTATPSPGFTASIANISLANPAVITTQSNHTLSLGDGIYIKGLTVTLTGGGTRVIDGFYLVDQIPTGGGGALVLNQLLVMDYSGNVLDASGWASWSPGATIQLANKVFDPNSYYAVTAVAANGVDESQISATATVLNNLDVDGSFNTIAWSAVAGASMYNVYKQLHGLFGFIGQTTATTFADNNIAPDMGITPPTFDTVANGPNNYPGAVGYFEQRKCYAGTLNQPQNFWASKSGTEDNFSYSLPTKDTDRIAFQTATREANTIRHIVPLLQLLLLTSSAEVAVLPGSADVLTPTTVGVRPQSYVGANNVQPSIVNNNVIYCAARGGHVREMAYLWQANGYVTHDISLRAAHLFDGLQIVDQCYMKARRPIVWFVSSSGDLIGLTYIPEEQIGAWHHHDTINGAFESIACVSEGAEDFLYAVVRRQINGATVRYIERMATRMIDPTNPAIADCFFVDAGATYTCWNTAGTTISVSHGAGHGTGNTLTASAPSFDSTSIGKSIAVAGPDGTPVSFTVTGLLSPTEVSVAQSALPEGYSTGTWGFMVTTLSGLSWLEGQTVSILADGCVQPQRVVTGGTIVLAHPAAIVQVGLPITADLQTLPATMQIDGFGQGRMKNVNKAWLKVFLSSGVWVGPDLNSLTQAKQRTTETYGTPPNPFGIPQLTNGEIEVMTNPEWQSAGQVFVRQLDPLPISVLGITLEVAIGG